MKSSMPQNRRTRARRTHKKRPAKHCGLAGIFPVITWCCYLRFDFGDFGSKASGVIFFTNFPTLFKPLATPPVTVFIIPSAFLAVFFAAAFAFGATFFTAVFATALPFATVFFAATVAFLTSGLALAVTFWRVVFGIDSGA